MHDISQEITIAKLVKNTQIDTQFCFKYNYVHLYLYLLILKYNYRNSYRPILSVRKINIDLFILESNCFSFVIQMFL